MSKKHSKTRFQNSWLTKRDKNGFEFGTWCQPTDDPFVARCRVCCVDINVSNSGSFALKQHSEKKKHLSKTGLSEPKTQTKFVSPKITNFVSADREQKDKETSNTPPKSKPKEAENKLICLTDEDLQIRSEIVWALKVCQANYSFASCSDLKKVFAAMFPDSAIASNFGLSRSKVSYLISHGLGPYFTRQLVNLIKSCPDTYFTLHFDETTTIQIKKQMNLLVRFFSTREVDSVTVGAVEIRFLSSFTFGHAFGQDVAEAIVSKLDELDLPLERLLSISTDGPNVNKTIKRLLNESVKKARGNGSPGLVDVGFCTIHAVSNSFRKAIEHFGKPIEDLVINLYYFFKMSSARREDFEKVQHDLGMDEPLHFVRHVQTRWLTLIDAVERLVVRYDAAVKFFLEVIPSKSENKEALQSDRYKKIASALKSEETLIYINFLLSVKPVFDSYLCVFQKSGPLIHCLHQSMVDLIKMLLLRFVKADSVSALSSTELKELDVTKDHVKNEDIDIGPVTKGLMKKMKSTRGKSDAYHGIKKFYETATKYLIQNMPWRTGC